MLAPRRKEKTRSRAAIIAENCLQFVECEVRQCDRVASSNSPAAFDGPGSTCHGPVISRSEVQRPRSNERSVPFLSMRCHLPASLYILMLRTKLETRRKRPGEVQKTVTLVEFGVTIVFLNERRVQSRRILVK